MTKFTVEPFESDKVLFQRVAPQTAGQQPRGNLYFYVEIDPEGTTPTLTRIDVAFPGSSQPSASYVRDVKIKAKTKVWLTEAEAFKFAAPPFPAEIEVSLVFAGAPTVKRKLALAPHAVTYEFFAKREDIAKYGEYITLNGGHLGDAGSQQFAQDANAVGWVDGKLTKWKAQNGDNNDRFMFGRPFYAMGNGLVIAYEDTNVDNPASGQRAVMRKASHDLPGQVKDLAVACLRRQLDDGTHNRILVATVPPQGLGRLTLLEQDDDGETLTERGSAGLRACDEVEVVALDHLHLAVAIRTGGEALLGLWTVNADGTLQERHTVGFAGGAALKLLRLSSALLLTAVREAGGTLRLALWQRQDKQWVKTPVGAGSLGPVGAFDLAAVDERRFVTAVQTQGGSLKVIAWEAVVVGGVGSGGTNSPELQHDLYDLVRRGDAEAGEISEVAMVACSDVDKVGTAVRQKDGTLKFIVWDVADGVVARMRDWVRDAPASLLQATRFKSESIAVASRTAAGRMHLSCLDLELSETGDSMAISVSNDEEETAGTTDLFRVATMDTAQTTLVAAMRTAGGAAKVSLWQMSGSNFIKVLYGNEIVSCVHIQQGSVPDAVKPTPGKPKAVTAGTMLGRMGNSGKSAGTHLHISADRVLPQFLGDVPKLMQLAQAGASISVIRPMQFRGCKAMRNSGVVQGGEAKNPGLGALDGHGVYFEQYVVLPDE